VAFGSKTYKLNFKICNSQNPYSIVNITSCFHIIQIYMATILVLQTKSFSRWRDWKGIMLILSFMTVSVFNTHNCSWLTELMVISVINLFLSLYIYIYIKRNTSFEILANICSQNNLRCIRGQAFTNRRLYKNHPTYMYMVSWGIKNWARWQPKWNCILVKHKLHPSSNIYNLHILSFLV
jgi:hypothetical protein